MTALTAPDVRHLVSIETIRDVTPIVGADAIEAATVRGWTVVVQKDQFRPGDRCVYFEIDSALPLSDPRFAFLAPRGTKTQPDGTLIHRLQTARLRGVYSQGLVIPAEEFPELADYLGLPAAEQPDVADLLGVTKYEPQLPTGAADIAGEFPTALATKTDSERTQNLHDQWDVIVAAGPWRATEKLDGTSLTVAIDSDGSPHVCSRNYELHDGGNVYWNAVRSTGLLDLLAPGEVVQAEIVGPGIQANPLGLNTTHVVVFTFTRARHAVPASQWPAWVTEGTHPGIVAAPVYDLDLPATAAEAVQVVDGLKSLLAPGRYAEGIVWHRANGLPLAEIGHRTTFKTISNKYLLKHGG